MDFFLEELKRICVFMMFAKLLLTLESGKTYEKYLGMIVEILILYMFMNLIMVFLGY